MLDEILEITAWFHPQVNDDMTRVRDMQVLMSQLVPISPIFAGLISKNDPKDPGVDLLDPALPERFMAWHAKFVGDFPDDAGIKLVIGAKPFLGPNGENVSSYRVIYAWSAEQPFDTIKIVMPMRFAENPDMQAFVAQVTAALTAWRPCVLISAHPSVLKMNGKLFPEYHSAGFGLWLPGIRDGVDLSDAQSVTTIGGGQLIVTAAEMFNMANSAAVERMHFVDGHLMQSGALPKIAHFPYSI